MDLSSSRSKIARFGLFEADLEQRVLSKEGLRVRLQDQPFQVLVLLLERPGEIVTREEIRQKLWPADTYVAFDDGLNTAIKKLRLALGDSADSPRFIETIPRRGYRFLAPPTFGETTTLRQGASDTAKLSPAAAEPAPDVDGKPREAELLEGGSRGQAWLLGGVLFVFAVAVCVTGLMIWRKHNTTQMAAESAAVSEGQLQPASRPARRPIDLRPLERRAIDPRAHEEYLQARGYWKQRTAEALTKAVDHFNQAIELDPRYAEAYAGLADCYIVLPMLSTVPVDDPYVKARQAAAKALALDDSVAEAHLAAAEINLYVDWDFPSAEKEFRRAIELDSDDAQAHQWYAEFLSLMGRHQDAIAQIRAAQHLDPSSMIIHHQAGQVFQEARMYSEALAEYRRALMIQPGFGPTYSMIALAYRRLERYPECLEADRQANLYWDPGGTAIKDLQRIDDSYRTGGKQAFLRASLEFDKKHRVPNYHFAQDHALLGENDEAVKWLQKAMDAHQPEILNMQNDPEFDRLRSAPQFQEIVKKVGLAPAPGTAESLARR